MINKEYCYSINNLSKQIKKTECKLGFCKVYFYVDNTAPVNYETEKVEEFYFYPVGGLLRDKNYNIVAAIAKLDLYKDK